MITKEEIQVGTKFKTRGKHPRVCTVVDIYTTTNLKGEVVQVEYVAVHEFMGQLVKGRYPAPSIQLGFIAQE